LATQENNASPENFDQDLQLGTEVQKPWKILIVDDDEQVHTVTTFTLSGVKILDKPIQFFHAYTAKEAIKILVEETNIAVILLDVVMETDSAGLDLIEVIRKQLRITEPRIILRTGQPGFAPELEAISNYDINDYRTKAELSRTKLITSLTTAIRSFKQLKVISQSQKGLSALLDASGDLFSRRKVSDFCRGVIEHLSDMITGSMESFLLVNPKINDPEETNLWIQAASGRFEEYTTRFWADLPQVSIKDMVSQVIFSKTMIEEENVILLPLRMEGRVKGVLYIGLLDDNIGLDRRLLQVFSANTAVALENVLLLDRLNQFAYFDTLVNLPNRNQFIQMIQHRLDTQHENWTVAIVDIDSFAEINDALGHKNGDKILKSVSKRLSGSLPGEVVVARVAGDAFGLLGPETMISHKVIFPLFGSPFSVNGNVLNIKVSVGFANLDDIPGDGFDALKNANIALKRVKKSRGKTNYEYYSEVFDQELKQRLNLLQELRKGIHEGELVFFYQPQVDMDGKIIGVESLVRWKKKSGEMISPGLFIPIAESSGLVVNIGRQAIVSALALLREFEDQNKNIRVAVNVSVRQFEADNFVEEVKTLLNESGIKPENLELEITESIVMNDVEGVIHTLHDLKALGVQIAIDDFGTGFSSLSYLQKLPLDRLKVDRAFVIAMESDRGTSLAEMIINLGKSLGLSVIAEGVETESQRDVLVKTACDEIQGYLYSRPLPKEELMTWIEGNLG
jgi:diguanylate cyclase (GGDEF)-like protein